MENKKNIMAAILSAIIPGLGQIIKAQYVKGLLIIVVGSTIGFMLAFTIIVPFLIWAWNVYDAYTSDMDIVNTKSKRVGV
ncbi:hypothetical protein [Pedobacter sp. SYSU D00535]|uniref:hypothetical protein n=1 Tax=Pedobacter sp. SYSU D00535 TaxID=2810308 RepID=UPI001A957FDD|nr:hypothetical protein [Pedobacter sp. SYSU D00535]